MLTWREIMMNLRYNRYKKFICRVLAICSSFILTGHSSLHASPNNMIEEEIRLSHSPPQSSILEDNFLKRDWLSHEAFKDINYTPGDFPFEYDTLANIGFTLDYQGESTDTLIAESLKTSQASRDLRELSHDATFQSQFKWPERIHGYLAIEYSNGNPGSGSGILIGPNHVLTAAHNLYDRHGSGWVKQLRFAPGRHHDDYPRGDYKGCIFLVPKKWGDRTFKEYEQYDYGIVILDNPIGVSLGWSGLLSLPGDLLQGTILSLTGYPGDKGTHDPHLPQMQKDYGTLKKVQGDQLLYDIKTYKGQSGGAIYVQQFPGYKGMYTIGVHTYGKEKEGEEYRGSYLTGEKFKLLVACLKSYQWPNVGSFIPQLQKVNLPSTEPFITEEIRKTYESWARGAESGNKEDLYHIGMLYMKGKNGIQKDSDKAYAFFYQAAQDEGNKKGYVPALTALGAWYEEQGDKYLLKAISLYQKARSKNNAEAIRRLGLLYLEGKGLPKQVQTAESLLKEAGEKGDGEAYYHLARLYEEGIHVTQNTEYAAQLYEQAQKLGYKLPDQAQVLVKPLTDEEVRSRAFTQVFQNSLQQVKSLEDLKQTAAQLTLFICYDKEDEVHTQDIEQFAADLVRAGIPEKNVYLDQWANRPGSNVTIYQHADRIFKADRVLVMGSQDLKEKYERKEGGRGISSHQIENLLTRITKQGVGGIIPLWFAGPQEECFPLTLRNIDQHFLGGDYFSAFFNLLEKILQLSAIESPLSDIKKGFEDKRLNLTSDLLKRYKTKVEEQEKSQREKDRKDIEEILGI
jgi:V8-like Glu-specific endopeptidase/TPR repeat protein